MNSSQLILDIINGRTHNPDRLNALSDEDWADLLHTANHHTLTPVMHKRLMADSLRKTIPLAIANRMKKHYNNILYRNILILHEYEAVRHLLEANDIPVIPLKGVFLAENVYDNIGLRPMADMDLLVKQTDLKKTVTILINKGFTLQDSYRSIEDIDEKDIACLISENDMHFTPMKHPDHFFSIELHVRLTYERAPFQIDMNAVWQRAEQKNRLWSSGPFLSLEDCLTHLCLHLSYQHRFHEHGLRGLYDIHLMIKRYEDHIDWKRLLSDAAQSGTRRCIWLTLALCLKYFDATPVPETLMAALKPNDQDGRLVELAEQRLFEIEPYHRPPPYYGVLHQPVSLTSKLKILFKGLFPPRIHIAARYHLSENSKKIFFFYFHRIFIHLKKYGRQWLNVRADSHWKVSIRKNEAADWLMRTWLEHPKQ